MSAPPLPAGKPPPWWAKRAAVRRLFFTLAGNFSTYVGVERADGVFLVSSRDEGVGRTAFLSGANPEFEALRRAVEVLRSNGRHRRGSVIVDVGANIGTTTVPALGRHGFGRALCFEPEPENLLVLAANVALNGLDTQVEVVAAAVSDAPGSAAFGRGPVTKAGRRAGVGSLSRRSDDRIAVDVVTLDGALAERGIEPPDVGLVWIDAQGHEGHVLHGAQHLLAARIPTAVALRPGKLRSAGGTDLLLEAAAAFEAFVDLRTGETTLRPTGDLAGLLDARRATDILLL